MTRKTKKEQALETRERLLDAAEDVFNENGVSRTALSDIAKAAGVTRGAIYWHFKNKSDLFSAMCERVRQPTRQLIENMADEQAEDPLDRLREGSRFCMQQIIDNPSYLKVFTILFHKCESLDDDDPIITYLKDWDTHILDSMEKVMRNAISRGHLPAELDIKVACLMMKVSFDGLLQNWLFMPDQFDLVETAARIHEACIHSMKTSAALLLKTEKT